MKTLKQYKKNLELAQKRLDDLYDALEQMEGYASSVLMSDWEQNCIAIREDIEDLTTCVKQDIKEEEVSKMEVPHDIREWNRDHCNYAIRVLKGMVSEYESEIKKPTMTDSDGKHFSKREMIRYRNKYRQRLKNAEKRLEELNQKRK